MRNKHFGISFVSTLSLWAFFAVLLNLLNVKDFFINALWLTVLLLIAILFCPILNHELELCCTVKAKRKKR